MRPANSSGREPARPVSSVPTAVPTSDSSRMGLRPTRSERRPQIGANTSWATENDENRAPMVRALAWKRVAYSGSRGRTTPKPTRSTATVVQMVPKPGGSGWRGVRERTTSGKGEGGGGVKSGAGNGDAAHLLAGARRAARKRLFVIVLAAL